MIRFLFCLIVVSTIMVGCSDPAAKFKRPTNVPQWDALDKLSSEEVARPIEMPAAEQDWAGVKAGATTAEFKAAVEGFAAAEIPAEFATEERKAAKDEAVKHYRALIEAAEKNGSADEIKAAYEAAAKSMELVRKPASPQSE